MMPSKKFVLSSFVFILSSAIGALIFQNCGAGFTTLGSIAPAALSSGGTGSTPAISPINFQGAVCVFNGTTLPAGASTTAYKSPTVLTGSSCLIENRTCTNGALSGSFASASCLPVAAGNCALGGKEISNGSTVAGYSAGQVSSDQVCSSIATTATCQNGTFDKTIFSNCVVAPPAACKFADGYIPNNTSVSAYLTSSVANGGVCSSQLRTCTNGNLSGSFAYSACAPAPSASCTFNSNMNTGNPGSVVQDGESVEVFSTDLVAFGQTCASAQEPITCKNGVFIFNDGSLADNGYSPTCVPASTSTCTYNGAPMPSGSSQSGYLQPTVQVGQTCNAVTATCSAGVITGVPTEAPNSPTATSSLGLLSPTCAVGACTYYGKVIANHGTMTAYTTPLVGHSQSCSSVQTTLTCTDGIMYDPNGVSYPNVTLTCAPAPTTTCSYTNLANGQIIQTTLQSGQTAKGYSTTAVAEGRSCSSIEEDLSCSDGLMSLNGTVATGFTLTGFSLYDSCNVGSCFMPDRSILLDGATTTMFNASFVAYGQACSSIQKTITCKNESLVDANGNSGQYSQVCTAPSTPDCSIQDWSGNKVSIKDGQSVSGFTRPSSYGATCIAETLACSKGLVSVNGADPTLLEGFYSYSATCK